MKLMLNDRQLNELKTHKNIVCVYKITNIINGKIYIGQTVNLRKRISSYTRIENNGNNRLIIKAIKYYGHNNFSIEILEECDVVDLNKLEHHYIKLFRSSNSSYGYNMLSGVYSEYNDNSRLLKSKSHIGLKESANTKRKKSNLIIAINDESLIICDSAKLFGDYIGKSKDYIKNCLRQPSTVNGYYLYYDEPYKRYDIMKKMMNKKSIRNIKYMKYLKFLNKCEKESVETIYLLITKYIGSIYQLKYENIDSDSKLFLTKWKPYIIEKVENEDIVLENNIE